MELLSLFALLDPKGLIGLAERSLMLQATFFMLIVAVPVFAITFFFAWYYRANNSKARYTPDWAHSKMEELIWWAVPLEVVLVLGALTWSSTHELDPPRAIASDTPAMTIQVVALPWKWLFIYPEQDIAAVNYLELPVNTPVRFEVTADAPMNSFWIPKLGGQIYAMTGMVTNLNLIANEVGTFEGYSANYSGEGFAQMNFPVHAVSQNDFDAWVTSNKTSSRTLTYSTYKMLAEPSTEQDPIFYASVEHDLYNTIVMQFMDMNSRAEEHHY